jgi:hypothetical protein
MVLARWLEEVLEMVGVLLFVNVLFRISVQEPVVAAGPDLRPS